MNVSTSRLRLIMISVVIPAHNECRVIARTLTAITTGALPDELDVIVICNGCTDNTAEIARAFGTSVRVIETRVANKTHALNLGDEAAVAFPRIYVDADVVVTVSTIRKLAERLARGDVIAVAPQPQFDLTGCSRAVRAFYDIRCRLPSFAEGIGGSGVYALSKAARLRFGEFPNLVADDTYVRVQFKGEERETLTYAQSIVFAPRTIKNLIAIEARADFGTFELARLYPQPWANKGTSNQKALLCLFKNPRLWLRLIIYVYVRAIAHRKGMKRVGANAFIWEQDQSSRSNPGKSVSSLSLP